MATAGPRSRTRRQELILSLIESKPIRNQGELLRELTEAGLSLTQSTLSRELKSLGIAKAPDGRGAYRYVWRGGAGHGPLGALASLVVSVERSKNLVVVKTPPGNAQGVARGLDEADWEEVMGTIAGDDTVLLICRTEPGARTVDSRLRAFSGRSRPRPDAD